MRFCLSVILLTVSLAIAKEPSFNCKNASTLSEKLICSSDTLKELDADLARKYGNSPSDANKQTQRAWIKERDKCLDKVCLVNIYQKRIAEISRQGITKYPFLPSLKYSSDDQLCEQVLNKYLNEFLDNDNKSELQEMAWKKIEEYGDIAYAELKFDNKSMFLTQFQSCCLRNNELYKSALFSSKDAFWDLNRKNYYKEIEPAIKDKGIEITPGGSIMKIDELNDIPIETSQYFWINPFEYKGKYYFENSNKYLWSRGEQKTTTLQILESGELKPVCVVQAKNEKENRLLKKENFVRFINLLADMNGGGANTCDGSGGYRQLIPYVVVPDTIGQISYTPWKDFGLDYGGREYGYVKRQLPYARDFIVNWSYDGIYNYDIYQQYNDIKDSAYSDLVRYYKEEFAVNDKRAKEWADKAYDKILSSHFVISSSYDYQSSDSLRTMLLKGESIDTIEPLLVGNWMRKEKNYYSYHNDYEPTLFYSLKHPKLVKLLLEKGADVNAANDFNKTALMYAAQFNLYDTAKMLLDNGINVNAIIDDIKSPYSNCRSINIYGVSALHYAARYADIDFIKLLLGNGADKELKDTNNKTPFDWLELYKNKNLQNNIAEAKKLLTIK
ncbi:MAG: ankyrin repeat domain-containing protein [Campylobacteraceae bacterium]|nr:ankyrin repeat domain-containing protein [Campylobacteraceae bacterium]